MRIGRRQSTSIEEPESSAMQGPMLAEPKMEEMKENVDFSGHHVSCFKKGDFPPPLPSLARKSYNHLPLQVPWVMLQAERGNNRVVLHEVKTAQQTMHMFQPIRKEGRLVLHMRRHDSDDEDGESVARSTSSASSVSSTELNSSFIAHEEEEAAAIIEASGIAGEGGSSSSEGIVV